MVVRFDLLIPQNKHKMKPDKKFRLVFLTYFFAICQLANAQQVSVMPQFFANNPLVKRDATFEKLQTYLGDAAGKTPLGLTENLTAKIKLLRQNVEELKLAIFISDKDGKPLFDEEKKPLDQWYLCVRYKFFDVKERTLKPVQLITFKDNRAKLVSDIVKNFDSQAKLFYGFAESENATSTELKKLILYLILNSLTPDQADFSAFRAVSTEGFSQGVNSKLYPFLTNLFDKDMPTESGATLDEISAAKETAKDLISDMVISVNSLV